jgi:hypothetical protein
MTTCSRRERLFLLNLQSARHSPLFFMNPEKNEQQTSPHLDLQVQEMFEIRQGISTESLRLFAYPTLPGHMQLR